MGSGARLRSANQAFGRSRTGAFLLSGEPPVLEFTCEIAGGVQDLFRQVDPSGEAVTLSNCTCDNWPLGQPFAREIRFNPGNLKGLGWEDPPHPGFQIVGETSGAVMIVPIHCAIQDCLPQGPIQWGRYGIIPGVNGADVDFGVVYPAATIGELPFNFQYVFGYWNVLGPGTPFITDEPCTFQIQYTPAVLPDPGPYNIVGTREDPQFSGFTLFELDRPARYNTKSAVNIQGTGVFDGVWEAERYNDHPSQGVNELLVEVPWMGVPATTGTLTRIFDQAYDCWANGGTGSKPPLPSP